MSFLAPEEPKQSPKPCRFFTSALRDALAQCQNCPGRLSSSSIEEESLPSDMDDEEDVIVLAIRSQAMEARMRRKASSNLSWVLPPTLGELFISPKGGIQHTKDDKDEEEDREAFLSAGSCLSRCSSASRELFFSVGGSLSRCSSASALGFRGEIRRRLMIQELCHCDGWPFGLCRKSMLLPPLPRSPSDSWSWSKGARMVKIL